MLMSFGLFQLLLLCDHVLGGLHEKRLLNYLFDPTRPDAHNPMERPSENDSQTLNVSVKFFLNQVMDVDEKNQVLTTIIWMDLSWNDYHFRWNPRDYGNVSAINLPYTAVWRPDILLYNCADEKFDRTFPTNTIMKHTGDVQWMPPGLFKSTCNIDILWFPFDEQNCLLKFGSWTYYGDQIDFRLHCINNSVPDCTEVGSVDLSEYSPNGEFHLMAASVKRYAQRYECCDYDFIDIKLNIRLQRRALYYVFNLIVPCLIISGMSLMVFMLPPDAGEKISLGVTILLSLTMFLQLVADKLPQTSEAIPLIGIYFSCTMIMCSLSIVFTVLVLNYHHRSADVAAVPSWIRTVVNNFLARLMFMQRPKRLTISVDDEDTISSSSDNDILKQDLNLSTTHDVLPKAAADRRSVAIVKSKTPLPSSPTRQIQKICAVSNHIANPNRSSRSLLANVLNIEDDFRASAIPMHQTSPALMDDHDNDGLKFYEHLPPPYSTKCRSNDVAYETTTDAFSPENLSDLTSADDTANTNSDRSDSTEPQRNLLSVYKTDLENIVAELRFITSKLRSDEKEAMVNLEWKFAARVIDRFCLIVFGIFNLLAAVIILFSAPNLSISFRL